MPGLIEEPVLTKELRKRNKEHKKQKKKKARKSKQAKKKENKHNMKVSTLVNVRRGICVCSTQ
ncbi:MAG: hypothetical protein ACLUSV_09460 [Streptococcus sp.]